jgi:hypothetical protein
MLSLEQVNMVIAEFERLGVSPAEGGIYTFGSVPLAPEELLARLRALPDNAGAASVDVALHAGAPHIPERPA